MTKSEASSAEARSILVVEDDVEFRETIVEMLTEAGYATKAEASAESALERIRDWVPDLVLTDHFLPEMSGTKLVSAVRSLSPITEVVVMTALATVPLAIAAVKEGAFDFIEKPINYDKLVLVVERAFQHQRLILDRDRLSERLRQRREHEGFVGESGVMTRLYELIRAVASSDTTVLIIGEHGTGKELVANAIHDQSPRSDGPCLRVNCAALPAGLLESAMFGHERGAFTGAFMRQLGHFERARDGTLLLDEVTEMTPDLQAKLLRVLQTGEFERVGGRETLRTNARVLAATNTVPQDAVAAGRLRADLYYRLNVVTIALPPLRDRKEDIPSLAAHFLRAFAQRQERPALLISPAATRILLQYDWPGNVRELENAMEYAVIFGKGRNLLPEDLPVEILDACRSPEPASGAHRLPIPIRLRELEHLVALQTVEFTRGNKAEAARLLGISRDTLYEKLRWQSQ